jgi:hypothetical protein
MPMHDHLALATKFVAALHDVSRRNPASWRRISAIGARTGIKGDQLERVVADAVTASWLRQAPTKAPPGGARAALRFSYANPPSMGEIEALKERADPWQKLPRSQPESELYWGNSNGPAKALRR